MRGMMGDIMAGKRDDVDIRVFLTQLAARGETGEEIAAAAQVLREHAVLLPLADAHGICDTCGTGGDGLGTINASTLAGIVAAAAGVRVVKHGNRAASSSCGSADLLEALGVNLAASPEQIARCVSETGFGFCFAQRFHPAMKAVASVRKEMGIRTIFNLIGPLANPAPLEFQVLGVSEERFLQPMAEALLRLGRTHALVVHGEDGMDEVSVSGSTQAREVRQGAIREATFEPGSFGLRPHPLTALKGGDPHQNAVLALEILSGRNSSGRALVIANAACAIHVSGRAESLPQAAQMAADAIDGGRARALMRRIQELTA
jgi:anthranilate phosphoribosyltransferase